MSDSIALARRGYELLQRGDLEGFLELVDPDVEFTSFLSDVSGARFHGHDGVRAWHADLREAFPDWRPEPERYEDYGDILLITVVIRVHGAGSGVPIEMPFVQVGRIEGGKIMSWYLYRERDEAIAAHGLSRREAIAAEGA